MMRRSSGRKASGLTTSSASTPAAGAKAAAKELERIDVLFSQYADKFEDSVIGPEGIERLCKDLGFDTSDIKALLLAWKMQASRQGFFSLDEWRKGFRLLRVDSIEKLKRALPTVLNEVESSSNSFREFNSFAFQYCLTEPGQKTLDLETASQMLDLVFGIPLDNKYRVHAQSFILFLKEQKEYKVMNLDQWTSFLRFCDTMNLDFENYSEDDYWPLLLDNFVTWVHTRTKSG